MQYVFCDSCRKEVKDPIRSINYQTVLDKALCPKCDDEFQRRISKIMMSKKKYAFLDQKKLLSDTLYKICK